MFPLDAVSKSFYSGPVADIDLEDLRIGATLRGFREERGLKPDEAAGFLSISRPHLMNIEAGRRKLTPELLAKCAALYGKPKIAIARPDLFESRTETPQGKPVPA